MIERQTASLTSATATAPLAPAAVPKPLGDPSRAG